MSTPPRLHAVNGDGPGPAAGRDPINVANIATATDWLRDTIGTGPLSGYFRHQKTIVYAPSIGPNGYTPPSPGSTIEDAATATVDGLAARVQWHYWPYKPVLDPISKSRAPEPAMFPRDAARTALSAPEMLPHIRDIRRITHIPLTRHDGTVLQQPGYDPQSQLLYLPPSQLAVPTIPDQPTEKDLEDAVTLITVMIADFAFITPHDKANYLGLLLTPLLTELAPPPYKLGIIGAPQPGSGKTLLANCALIIHDSMNGFIVGMPHDDDELRKKVSTKLATTSQPIILFDNVEGVIRSSVLAGLLTSAHWSDRKLGTMDQVTESNDRLWLMTGNNVTLGGDLSRRTICVTIDPRIPNPQLRNNFAIKNLEKWVTEHRGELLWALLVLIRSWVVAGQPKSGAGSDGYATWMETVSGILAHADINGTFGHPDSAHRTLNIDEQEWSEFVTVVYQCFGNEPWTVKELLSRVNDGSRDENLSTQWANEHPIPFDALPTIVVQKFNPRVGINALTKGLGRWIARRDGQYIGSLTIRDTTIRDRTHSILWKIHNEAATGLVGREDAYDERTDDH